MQIYNASGYPQELEAINRDQSQATDDDARAKFEVSKRWLMPQVCSLMYTHLKVTLKYLLQERWLMLPPVLRMNARLQIAHSKHALEQQYKSAGSSHGR